MSQRLRYNNLLGTLGGQLSSSATTISFATALTYQQGTAVPTLAGGNYIALTLEPGTTNEETVWLTAYTSGATTGTVTRGQEGTAVAHSLAAPFVNAITAGENIPYTDVANTFTVNQIGPFEDKGGAVYNVKAYGAKGDGTTDDTAAINSAITAAAAVNGAVLVPPSASSYLVSGTISNASFVSLIVQGGALFSGAGAPTTNLLRQGAAPGFTLYVASTGSDSNPGTSGSPFLTLQHAVSVAAQFSGNGATQLFIYVASGTYAGFSYTGNGLGNNNSGQNAATPPSICISGGNGGGTTTITNMVSGPAAIVVNGAGAVLSLRGALNIQSASGCGIFAYYGGQISVDGPVTFGACTKGQMHADHLGAITITNGYTIAGNATAHIETTLGGHIIYNETAITVTLTGSPVFSVGFVSSQDSSLVYIPSANITFSGACGATTPRFSLRSGATLETNSGTATYIPGTAVGQLSGGARYFPGPAPAVVIGSGFGSGATVAVLSGSTDQEGQFVITTGTGTVAGTPGQLNVTPAVIGPNSQQQSLAFTLQDNGGTWTVGATVKIAGVGADIYYLNLYNGPTVAIPVSTTLSVQYSSRPF